MECRDENKEVEMRKKISVSGNHNCVLDVLFLKPENSQAIVRTP